MNSPEAPPATLIPARMLNEFVYCPRLFYLEFVEGVFVHNADTRAGASQHKRVDSGNGRLPPAPATNAAASGLAGTHQPGSGGRSAGTATSPTESRPTAPGDAPSAHGPETIHSRSVSLFSDELGVTAKLDLVESVQPEGDLFTARTYSPVEYKKGAPREGDEGRELWDTDRMQLGLQMLLLRENGYPCTEGVVFYRQTRQRVRFELDADTEAWIRRKIAEARAVIEGPRPEPLDDSPKCPRCSLVSVCLPDETRLLKDHAASRRLPAADQLSFELSLPPPVDPFARGPFADFPEVRLPRLKPGEDIRRLIAPADDTKALYLNTPGLFLGKKGETLVAKEKKNVIGEFRLIDLHSVSLFGPIQLSSAVIQTLCERDIPIAHFTLGGFFYGLTRGHALTNVFNRIEQFRHAADPALALTLARLFVHGKLRNLRTLLMRNHAEAPPTIIRELKYAAAAALTATSPGSLLGIEGAASRRYFSAFSGMIKSHAESPTSADQAETQLRFPFRLDSRNRRPPRDPVNALLSMGYALLARDCTVAAVSAGFDPYVGFLHQPRFGRPALALDLMEEFRPLIADSVALTLMNNRMLDETAFVRAGQAVSLTPAGRKTFFSAYEKRIHSPVTHPVFGYKVSYRRAIELQFRLLAKVLTGEIEQYFPFMTR